MNDEELEAIRDRAEGLINAPSDNQNHDLTWTWLDITTLAGTDVPALLAEVGRLRAELATAVDSYSRTADILSRAMRGPEITPEYDAECPHPAWANKAAAAIERLRAELAFEREQRNMRHTAWLEGQTEIERLRADRDLWREKAERNSTLASRYQDALLAIMEAYWGANAASIMVEIADKAVRATVSGPRSEGKKD